MSAPRTPPRFVPTLTTVVDLPQTGAEPQAAPPAQAAAPESPVPAADAFQAISPEARSQLSDMEALRLEEQLLHRVLQRVDLSLEDRLSDTVAAAVQQHLDSMVPRLRIEIEATLRSLVGEALAQELQDNTELSNPSAPRPLG